MLRVEVTQTKASKWVGVVAVHQHIAEGVREWGVEEDRGVDQKESSFSRGAEPFEI